VTTVTTAVRPACPCPDHPDQVLQPLPGGGARGTCPLNGRSYQMEPVEVKATAPVHRLTERSGDDGALYRDYADDSGRLCTVKASRPDGVRPEPDTAAEAARVFAVGTLRGTS
jgi:hypothetical protein